MLPTPPPLSSPRRPLHLLKQREAWVYHASLESFLAASIVCVPVGDQTGLRHSNKYLPLRGKSVDKAFASLGACSLCRLQIAGYYNRYIGYTGDEFMEGVSLTHYDELMRWQKYAWGCSELVFNPFSKWLTRGPLTKLCTKFLFSRATPFHSKVLLNLPPLPPPPNRPPYPSVHWCAPKASLGYHEALPERRLGV